MRTEPTSAETPSDRQEIALLTADDTIAYPLEDSGAVTLDLSADPSGNLDIELRSTDEDGQTITVDRFNERFFADSIRRERAARRIAWTISQETDQSPAPEAVLDVFETIRDDLATDSVIPVDDHTKEAIENISNVTYTPGESKSLTIEHGRERFGRKPPTIIRNLIRFSLEQVGEGSEVPTALPEGELTGSTRDASDQWDLYRRVLFAMAEVGEAPSYREPLEITEPADINRLPPTVLAGIDGEELVEIIEESEQYSGHPERSVVGRLTERGGTRPSNSVLQKFIRELDLADELEDFDA
jgi:hypothetical protein